MTEKRRGIREGELGGKKKTKKYLEFLFISRIHEKYETVQEVIHELLQEKRQENEKEDGKEWI